MPDIRTKADVEQHADGTGPRYPAVNVKVRDTLNVGFRKFREYEPEANPYFNWQWIERHVSEETLDALFWQTCEQGLELIVDSAVEILGVAPSDVWQVGRSGGWIIVRNLPDMDEWDAVMLAKWRKFAKLARDEADDVMFRVIASVYINEFEEWVRA